MLNKGYSMGLQEKDLHTFFRTSRLYPLFVRLLPLYYLLIQNKGGVLSPLILLSSRNSSFGILDNIGGKERIVKCHCLCLCFSGGKSDCTAGGGLNSGKAEPRVTAVGGDKYCGRACGGHGEGIVGESEGRICLLGGSGNSGIYAVNLLADNECVVKETTFKKCSVVSGRVFVKLHIVNLFGEYRRSFAHNEEVALRIALFQIFIGERDYLCAHKGTEGTLYKSFGSESVNSDKLFGNAKHTEISPTDEDGSVVGNILVAHMHHTVRKLFDNSLGGGSCGKCVDFARVVDKSSKGVLFHFGKCLELHLASENSARLFGFHLLFVVALVNGDSKGTVSGYLHTVYGVLKLFRLAVTVGTCSLVVLQILIFGRVNIDCSNAVPVVVVVAGCRHYGLLCKALCYLLFIFFCKVNCHNLFSFLYPPKKPERKSS
nr:MAG TPA: hypothetical protein [Caudoviricetes sp.]